MLLVLVLQILHAWLPVGTASTGKYSSPVPPLGCWQRCSCSRHASVWLSGWEEVGIQVSHLSVALTTGVTGTDNISSAGWCCRELLLSKNRSRHVCSGWDSWLWMETTTWFLVFWNFGRWVDILSGKFSSLATWPCAQWVFWGFSPSITLLRLASVHPWGPLCLPLHFRFPFGTKFLKIYALKCLTWRCPSPLWDPTCSLNLLS